VTLANSTANGLISLKEKNNSQGLIDMGISEKLGVGLSSITNNAYIENLKTLWQVTEISKTINDVYSLIENKQLKNIFIFGEDPIGCAINKAKVNDWFKNTDFVVVQDYFITETAKNANLILPASLPFEIGGSFSNTQNVIQIIEKQIELKAHENSLNQISAIINKMGFICSNSLSDLSDEIYSLLPEELTRNKFKFQTTDKDNYNRIFDFGCDCVGKIGFE